MRSTVKKRICCTIKRDMPMPKGTPAMMGIIQWTCGEDVHANQKTPTGKQTDPNMASIIRASGWGSPFGAGYLRPCRLYKADCTGARIAPMNVPMPTPRKASPFSPGLKPWPSSNTTAAK